MSMARNSSQSERTRAILEDLEAVRENLLELSDDVWRSIDHNDPEALEAGVAFKREYNAKTAAFDKLAGELSVLVRQFTSVDLEAGEEVGEDDHERNERIIRELDRDAPHSLDEDLTFKRPHGFILAGRGVSGLTIWKRLYELVCRMLLQRDPARFAALVDHPDFLSSRGNRSVTRDPGALRSPLELGDGLHVESNLSANGVRDMMRRLLVAFEIEPSELKLFLREDRDAGREEGSDRANSRGADP